MRNLAVFAAQLHSQDDSFPIILRQSLQGPLIAFERLVSDGLLQRRWTQICDTWRQLVGAGVPGDPPRLVGYPVVDGLAQIRLERSLTAILEGVYMS